MSASRRDAVVSTLAIVIAGGVVVTCSASRQHELEPNSPAILVSPTASDGLASASSSASASATAIASSAPSSASSAPPIASAAPRLPRGALPLPRLYASLADLAAGSRKDHVRIAWLGDSHTAADLWTGAVRRGLQARFGDGGPGFVRLGWDEKRYRHEGVKIESLLSWNTAPVPYAKVKREDDGVFGLGGARLSPVEADAQSSITITDKQIVGDGLTWEIAYRAAQGESFTVKLGKDAIELPATPDGTVVEAPRHHSLQSAGTQGTLQIMGFKGHPQLFGVSVESNKPGVVLDTIGLNGARVGTFLAWDAETWQAELTRRKPDLVVLAFGTNESSDDPKSPEKYRAQTAELLSRAKAASPDAECLVILPMDRKGLDHEHALKTISAGMTDAAHAAGCAVWSAFDAMGGAGSIEAWSHESPPRSGADGVHLSAKGYSFLGEKLASDLLAAVPARRDDHP